MTLPLNIAIGFPSGENVNVQFTLSLISMLFKNPDIPIAGVLNCCSSRIAFNRNVIVMQAQAISPRPTHLLFIDSDMVFPPDSMRKLLSHDLDIVGATASRRNNDNNAIGTTLDGERLKVPSPPVKMRILGMPFMLIKMEVFDKIVYPWFAEPPSGEQGRLDLPLGLVPEDEYFCSRAIAAGFDVHCDVELSMKMGHRGHHTFHIMPPEKE